MGLLNANSLNNWLTQTLPQNARNLWGEIKQAPEDLKGLFTNPNNLAQLNQTLANAKSAKLDKDQAMSMAMDYLQTTNPVGGLLAHTVYHGSPHKFNKFDMSKIGTGEGAQAYGHGLYFAEVPDVARTYGKSTTPGNRAFNSVSYNGQEFPAGSRDGELLYDITIKGRKSVIENLQKQADRLSTINPKESQNLLARIEYAKTIKPDNVKIDAGNLYKVDIPDEAIPRMLDWDKPLSEQPHILDSLLRGDNEYQQYASQLSPEMRKIADDMVTGKLPVHSDDISGTWQPLLDNYPNLDHNAIHDVRYRLFPETDDLDWLSGVLSGSSKPGSGVRGGGGADLYNLIGHERLKELGIPGIRYLDGSSRNIGEGTSNFVLFDDQLPRILEINGQPTGLLSYADEAKKAKKK